MKIAKSLITIIFIGFILLACSRTTHLRPHEPDSDAYKKFNYLGKNRSGIIKLQDNKTIHAKTLELENDILKFSSQSDSVNHINTDQIKSVYFKDHFVGGFDGFLFGFMGGGLVGLSTVDKDVEGAGWAILGYGALGSAIGAIVGGIKGSKLIYYFESKKEPGK